MRKKFMSKSQPKEKINKLKINKINVANFDPILDSDGFK